MGSSDPITPEAREAVERLLHVEEKNEALAVWFTPMAIRDAFDGSESERAEWVRAATVEELVEIGQQCIGDDLLWRTFHEVIERVVDENRS